MSKNNTSHFLILDDYKNDQKGDYLNIAKQNEENFKTKKFEKFKPKNSIINTTNILKGEENKLKQMLFSIIKYEESQISEISPINRNKNKISNTNSSIEGKDQIKNIFNKNNRQFKKFPKNSKKINRRKIKKMKLEMETSNCNYTPKNINTNLCITPQNDLKKTFSFETPEMKKQLQKELKIINSCSPKKKKSRNNYSSAFSKNEKDFNSDENQTSNILLNSSKKLIEKNNYKLPAFFNKKEKKNCLNINISKIEKLKNNCKINNKNKEKNKKFTRSLSLKNKKNLIRENFNVLTNIKRVNSVSITTNKIRDIKNSLINFYKNEKSKLKINNLKILKINKEKIKRSIILRPNEEEKEYFDSSRVLDHKDRPRISGSFILPPKKFSSTRESFKNIKQSLSKIYKNEKIKKVETKVIKSSKTLVLINEKFRKLIHKGLVYDSLDDEEIEHEETASNNFYLDPNSRFCFIFDLIIFFLTAYISITIPYFLAKNLKACKELKFSFFHLFNYLSEIFNVMDLILGFFRAYYNYDEQLIKKKKLMIKHYINSWFLIDLISTIPFYTIIYTNESDCTGKIFNKYYSSEMNNLHYLFLCIKMIKLLKIFKNNRGYKGICLILNHYLIFQDKGALIAKTYMILLIFHFGACIHIFIARNSYPNWILNAKMETNGFSEIYITAIYCLTMTITSVGYGDITCYSFNERIFQIILLIFGIGAYSWIVSSISNHIEKENNNLNDLTQKIDILKDIKLHHSNLPNKLYSKIIQHLKYRNQNEKKNKNLIFDCLPQSLKNSLIYEMKTK